MPSSQPATRARRTIGQRLVLASSITMVLVAFGGALTLGYLNTKLGNLQRLSLAQVLTPTDSAPGAPQNYLLVGTDDASTLGANDQARAGRGAVTGARSDTIMILHVDPKTTRAVLLSLPRDLWVTIAGTNSEQKINAAIQLGGPSTLIRTIEDNFQIPINHYVEVDFAGFKKLVSAVDGVPVYFNVPFRDLEHTGFNIETPGCYTLDPDQALAYARARYVQYYVDGFWHDDGTADLGRISRQQDFLRRALSRSVTRGVRNPVVLNQLVDAGLDAVTVDDKLTSGDLVSLGRRFRSFDPGSLETMELPVMSAYRGGQSAVVPRPEAQEVLDIFRGVQPGDQSPSAVTVQVFNGTGRYNEATDVSDAFHARGFATGAPSDAIGTTGEATLIRYAPGDEATARLVARYLDSTVSYIVDASLGKGAVSVVTGKSFVRVRTEPRALDEVTGPTTTTSTTAAPPTTAPGETTVPGQSPSSTNAPTTTSTTVTGFVPDNPPPGITCG